MRSAIQDDDEKLLFLIQKFGSKELLLVFCRHVITFKNLFMSTAKELRREEMTPMEKK